MIDINKIPSPCYVMEEKLLRNNLSLIKSVKERAGVNIILAFKAFALWKAFRSYVSTFLFRQRALIRGPVGLRGDGKSGAYLFPGLYGG